MLLSTKEDLCASGVSESMSEYKEYLSAELASLNDRLQAKFEQQLLRQADKEAAAVPVRASRPATPQSSVPAEDDKVDLADSAVPSSACERWGMLVSQMLEQESLGPRPWKKKSEASSPAHADVQMLVFRGALLEEKVEQVGAEPHPDWLAMRPDEPTSSHNIGMRFAISVIDMREWSNEKNHATPEHRTTLEKLIIHPDSNARSLWCSIGALLLVFDTIFIPLEAASLVGWELRTMVYCTTAYWVLDMVVHALTGYTVDTHVEMTPSLVCWKYARSWLPIDLGLVLLDLMFLLLDLSATTRTLRVVRLVRLLRLLRLRKWLGVFRSWMFKNQSELLELLVRVAGLVSLIVIINHYVACAWYGLGKWSSENRLSWSPSTSWIEESGVIDQSHAHRYVVAFHWSMTQFLPSTNNIAPASTPERIFASVVIIGGMLMFSGVISAVGSTLSELRSLSSLRERQRRSLMRFIQYKHLSPSLSSRMLLHVDLESERQGHVVVERDLPLLLKLPESVRVRMHLEMYLSLIKSSTILSKAFDLDKHTFFIICHEAMMDRKYCGHEDVFLDSTETSFAYVLGSATGSFRYLQAALPQELRNARRAEGSKQSAYSDNSTKSAWSGGLRDKYMWPCDETVVSKRGSWLAEGALWMKWTHFGSLSASNCASIVVVDCDAVRQIVQGSCARLQVCMRCCALLYANQIEMLGGLRSPDVDDLGLRESALQDVVTRALKICEP